MLLPLRLLDRLLASELVPREAKFSAIERWQLELAEVDRPDRVHRELGRRLVEARLRLLRGGVASRDVVLPHASVPRPGARPAMPGG
jgi:hypothetical protein